MRAALVVLMLGGCSIAFQEHIPAKPLQSRTSRCASTLGFEAGSLALPIADTIMVAAETGGGVYGAVHGYNTGQDGWRLMAGTALFAGVIQLASAVNGYRRASECNSAIAAPVATAQR